MRKSQREARGIDAARRQRLSKAVAGYLVEGLERRVCLSSAIAAFGAQQTFAVGSQPQMVLTADVNGDGKSDLVAVNAQSNTIAVLLGNGNGTFHAAQTFGTGTKPYAAAVADVNGDGKLDVVVANSNSANVSVLLGNNDGTFGAQQTFAAGSGARSVAIADINGDGKLDLAVANKTSSTGSILLGNGNGAFQSQQTFAAGAGTAGIAVADLNGDGKLDVAVVNQTANNAGVFLGNGNGTLQAQHTFATGSSPAALVIADTNADGKPDLLVANSAASSSGDSISALLGNGNGTLQAQQTFTTVSAPASLAVSDVNDDGKPDIVTANGTGNVAGVLLGLGNGTFQPQKTFAVGSGAVSVAVTDLNRDGRPDLVVANSSGNTVSALLGDVPPVVLSMTRTTPLGPFTSASSLVYTVTFNEQVTGVDAADFTVTLNGVTATTPVVVTPVSSSVYTVTVNGVSGNGQLGLNLVDNNTILNSKGNPLQPGGAAGFASQQTFAAGDIPVATTVADFNGDGKPDVALADYGHTPSVAVLLGNGDGTFQTEIVPAPYVRNSVSAADVNRDGKMDLLTTGLNGVEVFLGNGNGTFQAPQTMAFGAYSQTSFIAAADVNVDGNPDLFIADPGTSTVHVLLGNGDGTFKPEQTFYAGFEPREIIAADINGDGKPDLAAADTYGDLGILLGNGDGTFQPQLHIPTGISLLSIASGDINGDGKPDLVVVNRGPNNGVEFLSSVGLFLGNGNGTFKAQKTFAAGVNPWAVTVGDVNGDGKPDIVAGNQVGSSASVLLGNGDGTFQAQQTLAAGSVDAVSLALVDFNNDGKSDLVIGNETGDDAGILLGNADGRFVGQIYNVLPYSNTINANTYRDNITLVQDTDHLHIDWLLNGAYGGQVSINDPAGLTINGNGPALDTLVLNYTNGNPLPNELNLNGVFIVSDPTANGNSLAGTTIDLKTSTLFITYAKNPGADPMSLLQSYLKTGFNGGAWNGTAATGAIQSNSAAANPTEFSIGYADGADVGNPAGLPANFIELRYTAIGDTNLDGTVGGVDYAAVVQNYNTGTKWDQGDVTYEAKTGGADYADVVQHYGHTAPSPAAVPTMIPAITPMLLSTVPSAASTPNSLEDSTTPIVPALPTDKHKAPKGHKKQRH